MNTHSTFPTTSPISAEERARRKESIDFARGSVRFEGVTLTTEMEALNQRYINGELGLDEYLALGIPLAKETD